MSLNPLERESLPEYETVFKASEEAMGFVPNSLLTMARDPELFFAFGLLSKRVMNVKGLGSPISLMKMMIKTLRGLVRNTEHERIDDELRHLVSLAVSYSAGCRYCQAHTTQTARVHGIAEEKIAALFNYESSDLYSEAEKAALSLAFAAGEVPNSVDLQHFSLLNEYFNEMQIVDLVSVVSFFGFLNRWNDTMGTALETPAKNTAEVVLKQRWEIGKHK
ncbi:MAG: carboxymuconolactone decarboxylase family protein [Pseudomonadales bacterium]|nr:carboxymuconolactone decarboxylase family protein [Pseudomonadales bacterium]